MSKTNLKINKPVPVNKNKDNENAISFSTQNNSLPVNKIQASRQTIIQPKLEIGKSGDKYEKEADSFADKIMMMSDFNVNKNQNVQNKIGDAISPFLQTSISGTSEELILSSNFENQLNNSNNNGNSLPNNTRSFMESSFGVDFSNVKIHTDNNAVQMNKELNANAFTNGFNIYFNSGKLNPESSSGKHLLAHELTHVVQQSSSNKTSLSVQKEETNNSGAFSFNFDLLPPDLKLKLGSFMLHVNTGTSELSFTQNLMKTTLGYSYGGDISLGESGKGFSSRLGFNPSNDQISLGLGYDKFKFNSSLNPNTGSLGLNFNYGAPLLPMPGDLTTTMNNAGNSVGNVASSLGTLGNPLSFYNKNSDDIKNVMTAVKSATTIDDAKQGTFGAGLKFTYNPQSGVMIYGGLQWLF